MSSCNGSCPEGSIFQECYRGWSICQIPPHPPVQPMPLFFGVKDSEETPRVPVVGVVKAMIDEVEGPVPRKNPLVPVGIASAGLVFGYALSRVL